MRHPSGRACSECGAPLDVVQAARNGLCDRQACIARHAVRARAERERRERRQAERDHARAVAVTNERIREAPLPRHRPCAVFAIPASPRRATTPPRSRLDSFRHHLEGVIEAMAGSEAAPVAGQAATTTPEAGRETDAETISDRAETRPPPTLEALACATCRGDCCADGGTHAFIDEEVLNRWLSAHPGEDLEACRNAYLGRLEGTGYEDSCVFLGTEGCRLDRGMRSDVCNGYECNRLTDLRARQARSPAPVVSLVALHEGRALRLRLVDTASDTDLGEHSLEN